MVFKDIVPLYSCLFYCMSEKLTNTFLEQIHSFEKQFNKYLGPSHSQTILVNIIVDVVFAHTEFVAKMNTYNLLVPDLVKKNWEN